MKTLTVVLVVTVLVIHISGYLIQVPTEWTVERIETVPAQWVHVQKMMIPLFENVCEDSNDPVIRNLAQEFTFNPDDYTEPSAITNLQKLKAAGLMPKGEIFSEYNPEHMKELKIIYEVLDSAKNFDAFYKAAAWARQNLNCGLFVNAIYLTIQSRKDTERLSIPAPYEVLPNYFVRKEVLVKASTILAGQEVTPSESIREDGNAYIIDANYTAMFYDNDDDSKLAYFREDIGLNSYYFLRKLRMSPWLNNDINGRYGENVYQMMKQFMARYNLERYANGMPEIEGIDWNSLPDINYDPELVYSDGIEFSHRTKPLVLPVNDELALLQTIENNIVTVASHMRQSGYNKTQILNHLMEILVTGERSYETLARQLLGKDHTNNGHVSVLEHCMTSMRDPMFWKINKKIVDLVDSALKLLPTYSRSELYFPGVEIVNIDVKKMMTAYDYFEFDVTDALKLDNRKSPLNIKIGQPRLNHKPFTVKLNISSLVTKKGLVKIYLGPKLMPGELAAKKNLFTLLDVFEVSLKIGSNIISRTSNDMKHLSSDFISLKTIKKQVVDAEFGLDSLPLKMIHSQIGYPNRLILPKGLSTGLPIQMFVFIAPFTKASMSSTYSTNTMDFNSAILSPGYPLDLMIEDKQLFSLPNALIKYVTITQKGDSKVENYGGPGVTKQWYGTNTYDPSSRPSYSPENRKTFDYNSKRGPPTKNENNADEGPEYLSRTDDYNTYSLITPSEQESIPKTVHEVNLNNDIVHSINYLNYVKEPFDSKAKFEKKDNSAEREENSNKMTSKEENDIWVPINKDLESDEYLDKGTPRLLKSASYDYSSKYKKREPFDYNARKVQFDKKDYSRKREDYTKYRTAAPTEVEATSIKTQDLEELLSNEIKDSVNLIDDAFRLLKSSKFDYASKNNKEPFDYKAKKAQFDKKDYSAKKDYTKYRTVAPIEEEVEVTTTETPLETDLDWEEMKESVKEILNTPRLLKSSKFDYSAKRKETFDYKAKKAQFDKKDYSAKRGDYTKYRTVPPSEEKVTTAPTINEIESNEDGLARIVLEKDTNNLDLISEVKENNINVDNDDNDLIDIETFPLVVVRNRTPTIYDFLFHAFDHDYSPEIKVYE
ncbi:hypothetical protein B5X24_HaOG208736 [Helicoverpa armigera]|uniref:Arylphorin subunit alpha-like n=1 Tax=Helicoverpa armigera TaxID=29058 RepID=A0A2W1BFH1_HELAM|nr:hypothetical protein B5X24_HaOG208736 [Helicoverpa armigera]